MGYKKKFNRSVTVVKKKNKPSLVPEKRVQLYSQDEAFSSIKTHSGSVNIAVRVLFAEGNLMRVAPISESGLPLDKDGAISVKKSMVSLDNGFIKKDRLFSKQENVPVVHPGDVLDLKQFKLHKDGKGSFRTFDVLASKSEHESGRIQIIDNVLVSIRHSVVMEEGGLRPEVFLLRRNEAMPIYKVMTGLQDMIDMLNRNEVNGASGFLLRGEERKTGRRHAEVCSLTFKQRKRGVAPGDSLAQFLKEGIPGVSKMIREAGTRTPWQIVPVDICLTTEDFSLKANQLARRIPFNKEINGQTVWFALSAVAIKQDKNGKEISYINPRRDFPMLVGKDYPEGGIEPDITLTSLDDREAFNVNDDYIKPLNWHDRRTDKRIRNVIA